MNIASAFLMGTKIKEAEVPDEPWTKIATFPNTSGISIEKSGIAYNGNIYVTAGRVNVPRYETVTFPVYKFNGKTWSEAVTLTSGSSEYTNWWFEKGQMLFFTYAGKLYMTHAHFGDYGLGGPKMGWVFDGSTWQTWDVPVSNLSQAIEKNGKLYLFETSRRGAWNVSYWWNVYEYNDSDGSVTLVAQNVADYMVSGSQDGRPLIANLNGELHAIGAYRYNPNGQYHFIINDDWSCTQLNAAPGSTCAIIAYKNKIHAFLQDNTCYHAVWESVNDVWEAGDTSPYTQASGIIGWLKTMPTIYKKKLVLLGVTNGSDDAQYYKAQFDEFYRYNK